MRITLMTVPARGDTEPFVALAVRLAQLGHQVKLAARPDFEGLVRDNGIDFAPLGNPYRTFMAGAAEAGAMGSGHPFAKLRFGFSQRRYVTERLHEDAWEAAQGSEAIVYKYPWITPHTIAEKLDIPCVPVMLLPLLPTRVFPSFVVGRGVDRGRVLNRLVWSIPAQAIWSGLRQDDKKLRRSLGLSPLPRRVPLPLRQSPATPVLCEWSEAVLPRPPDWPDGVEATGYWFLDPPPAWAPPPDLVDFLGAGPPPVCIGFGSMADRDPATLLNVVIDALDLSGQRGVLLSGWGALASDRPLPETVFRTDALPHGWLFPRAAVVVHHGGAGTTAAALRAGTPSVVTPVLADQPSWGRRLQALGVGPAPIPWPRLDAETLAGAIRTALTDDAMRLRASELGSRLRSEDGLGRAAQLLLSYV